jgi:hypothetical protein
MQMIGLRLCNKTIFVTSIAALPIKLSLTGRRSRPNRLRELASTTYSK